MGGWVDSTDLVGVEGPDGGKGWGRRDELPSSSSSSSSSSSFLPTRGSRTFPLLLSSSSSSSPSSLFLWGERAADEGGG